MKYFENLVLDMYRFKLLLLSLSLLITKGCYPVSHVIVGETQTPLDYTDVKVYTDYTLIIMKKLQLSKQVVI